MFQTLFPLFQVNKKCINSRFKQIKALHQREPQLYFITKHRKKSIRNYHQ